MPTARINVFQKLVLRWEQLHPYNGAQVMRVRGPVPEGLETHWNEVLRELGIAGFARAGTSYGFSAESGDRRHRVEQVATGTTLDAALTEHLNRRFADEPDAEYPMRLMVMPAEGDSHYVAVSYRHFLADSVAIRLVLRALFERVYLEGGQGGARAGKPGAGRGGGRAEPLRLAESGYWRLFGPRSLGGPLRWSMLKALASGTRQVVQMKQVRRVETRTADTAVAYMSHPMPEGTIDRVLGYARARGIRVNDVLLAAIGLAIRDCGPTTATSRRKNLALGSIVDLRPLAGESKPLERTFGMFLGFTTALLTPEDGTDLQSAAGAMSVQHARHRADHAAGASFLRMSAALVAHRLYRRQGSITEWYRKRVPLAAGISNVNLRGDWPGDYFPGVLMEYQRVSPTGPMMPLVFSATTLGSSLHLGLTRRTALVPEAMAESIVGHVRGTLATLAV